MRYSNNSHYDVADTLAPVIMWSVFALVASSFAAWLTHIVWIVEVLANNKGATAGQIVLSVTGTFIPPIGVVHGWIIWFT